MLTVCDADAPKVPDGSVLTMGFIDLALAKIGKQAVNVIWRFAADFPPKWQRSRHMTPFTAG
ncbi:hypothetical protein GCM10011393_00490 [Sphingopyxis bauzanensis]|nr:hypothetical protein GCM10011393_00490 [Sphingopyxis bauzanensis]